MKKLSSILLFSFIFLNAKAQSVEGNWEGALSIQGTEIPIIYHIKKDSTGKISATFDSPKQKAFGLPCNEVIVKADSLILMMKVLNGKYEGMLSPDGKTLTGKWFQGGGSLPLDLKKTSDVATTKEVKRPQTPKPSLAYQSDDVIYFNADKSIQFGATFTCPVKKVKQKFPVVLLITGSGQEDRDETIYDHKSFAVIADYLSSHGIAVLRVDDRGIGKTTGNYAKSNSADFAKDVDADIDYLKTRTEVDISNIGLIGHSEGGMIAPMVASKRKDIKFIVLLAGPAVPIIDLMAQQNVDVATAAGVDASQMNVFKLFYKKFATAILKENDVAAANKIATAEFTEWQNNTAADIVKNTTGVTDDKSKQAYIASFVKQLRQPWLNYFMKANPAEYLKKVHCAVLALNGEKDVQVAAKPNLEAIRSIMVANKITKFKVQEMPGLNHLFQHCNTCSTDEYGDLEETFAPEVLTLMGDWIKEVVSKQKSVTKKKH